MRTQPSLDGDTAEEDNHTVSISETALAFVDGCDTGKGWDVCKQWCTDDATFAVQADALGELATIEDYVGWAKGLLTPIPDGNYELKGIAADEARGVVVAFAVFHGTQTGDGGPVAPTGNTVASDYVYAMEFDGDKIRHLTKVWNDGHALGQLGWV